MSQDDAPESPALGPGLQGQQTASRPNTMSPRFKIIGKRAHQISLQWVPSQVQVQAATLCVTLRVEAQGRRVQDPECSACSPASVPLRLVPQAGCSDGDPVAHPLASLGRAWRLRLQGRSWLAFPLGGVCLSVCLSVGSSQMGAKEEMESSCAVGGGEGETQGGRSRGARPRRPSLSWGAPLHWLPNPSSVSFSAL